MEEDGENINLIIEPKHSKAYWPSQPQAELRPLTEIFQLDVCPPAEGLNVLGVPLGSISFVSGRILLKFDEIDEYILLVAAIQKCRIAHRNHRATESACRVTHPFRLIPPENFSTLWQDFDDRLVNWFEGMCKVPKSEAARLKLACRQSWKG